MREKITQETPATPVGTQTKRRGELLIRFREDTPESSIKALLESNGARRAGRLRGDSGIDKLEVEAASDLEAVAAMLRSNSHVEIVEPNFPITADQAYPNDPRFSEQWSLHQTARRGAGVDIGATEAWSTTKGSQQIVIAVIDSGIDWSHPDLRRNQWSNRREQVNNQDDDGDEFVDDVNGWNWVAGNNITLDEQGHGTAVAGIIAAEGNNRIGISGVMWRARLMSLKVLDATGAGHVADAIEAIDYAIAHGAQIINCSWGTEEASITLKDAISRAMRRGVSVVCSAGNRGRKGAGVPHYPASFELPDLLAVGATDDFDSLAAWSNFGSGSSHIAAPGVNILTTKMGGGYEVVSGTSFSAPLVSGVAGLVRAIRPRLSAERTRELIIKGARIVPQLSSHVAGGRVVHAGGALSALSDIPSDEGIGVNDAMGDSEDEDDGNRSDASVVADRTVMGGNSDEVIGPKPSRGAGGGSFPNLDEMRRRRGHRPHAPEPIPSTRRRCRPNDPNCNGVSLPRATPLPLPSISSISESYESLFAGLDNSSLRVLMGAVSDAVQPLASLPLLDHLRDSSVTDAPLMHDLFARAPLPAVLSTTPSPNKVYLSDLNWTYSTNDYYATTKDRTVSGGPLVLKNVTYEKGLGVHAASDVRFALGGAFSTFITDVGIDQYAVNLAGNVGTVVFQVWVDGQKYYDSGVVNGSTPTQTITVNVTDKQELRLVVTQGGDGPAYDHADWAGARLMRAAFSPNLVAQWKFNEGSGTTTADATGNGNTGAIQGATWSAGKIGGALDFNGVNQRVSVSSNTGLADVLNDFTLAFWAYPDTTHEIDGESTSGFAGLSGQKYIWGASAYNQPGHSGALLSVGTNGVSVYEHAAGYMPALLSYQGSISGWTHITLVYENRQPRLYVNGALVKTGQVSPKSFIHIKPEDIGGMVYGHYDGRMDEARLYEGVLAPEEIATLATTDLVARWKFDEGSGTTTTVDATGNGNDGSVQGASRITGRVGTGALNFNAAGNRVPIAGNSSLADLTNTFTLSFWASPQATHQIDDESVSGASGVSGKRYVFGPRWYNSGHAGAGVSVGTNGISVIEHADGYMPAVLVYPASITDWTHIAVVYENRQPRLYVNGALVRTGLTGPKSSIHILPQDIGGSNYGEYRGLLDEVQIYGKALSPQEIATMANQFSNEVYLSDLDWTYVTHNYHQTRKDRNAPNTAPIALDNVVYPKGLGTHAPSDIRFNLGGQYATFISDIGIDNPVTWSASVVFEIWADGQKLYDSGLITHSTPTRRVTVGVAGKRELKLIVTDGGDGPVYDHANWAGARLVRATQEVQPTVKGLRGKYYDNLDFTDFKTARTDSSVNFDWGQTAPAQFMGAETFSAQWTGLVAPKYSEEYTFYTVSDDGVRLWVDRQLVIDNWTNHAMTENSGTILLNAGQQYDIRMEYFENSSGAVAKLLWSSPSQSKEVIPQSQLYACSKSLEQFVRDFYQGSLARQPGARELHDWVNKLAQAEDGAKLLAEARSLGHALFESQEYLNRARTNPEYVGDLYKGYYQRDPQQDQIGWDFWTSQALLYGRATALNAFERDGEFIEKVNKLCGTLVCAGFDFATSRFNQSNRTGISGVDLYSGNFNWNIPLLHLPGRAGLDLELTLAYNALVWTKDEASRSIKFDADDGTPAPGFRLGFPVVQARYNGQGGRPAYPLITSSGKRIELRLKTGTSNVYESEDSSRLELIDYAGVLLLRTDEGTRFMLWLMDGQYQCTEIKDANGNFISVAYNSNGRIQTITDTLGRVINFNYDDFLNPLSITQTWKRETESGMQTETHTWATFGYANLTINTNFDGLSTIGPQNGQQIPVLTQVGLDDGTRYNFSYSSWGQVYRIARSTPSDTNPANYVERAYSEYNLNTLASSRTDCPRFTERRDWVENWNGLNNVPSIVVTGYETEADGAKKVTLPDGTVHREYFGGSSSGWLEGLTLETKTFAAGSGTPQKRVTYLWEQDDETKPYHINPRVKETNVYDDGGNRRRTRFEYKPAAEWSLLQDIFEYAGDGVTVRRRTHLDYSTTLQPDYINHHIIGLISAKLVYKAEAPIDANLVAKVDFQYDNPDIEFLKDQGPATQHDPTYNRDFKTRGNVWSVRRWNVDFPSDASKAVEQRTGYNTNGSPILSYVAPMSPLRVSYIDYTDKFSDGVNRNTFAYPTSATDPEGYQATSIFNYSMGAVTRVQTPKPNETQNIPGPVQLNYFDEAGRIRKTVNVDNAGSFTRWEYPASLTMVQTFSTIESGKPETYSVTVLDGAGRVRGVATDFPDSTGPGMRGNYSGQRQLYNIRGLVEYRSNPTEMTTSGGVWTPAGDDAGDWRWTHTQYDWQDRVVLFTDQENKTRETLYGGCGCAGGQKIITRDEVGRRQILEYDAFNNLTKSQQLFEQPLNQPLNDSGTPYSTIVYEYNARDQVKETRHFPGASETSGVQIQRTIFSFDGHGRPASRKAPEQTLPTTFSYNADDTLHSLIDARGVTASYSYNSRRMVTGISYSVPNGVASTPNVSFGFDAAGNRLWMKETSSAGEGRTDYEYDMESRLRSEKRKFVGLNNPNPQDGGAFRLTYNYNLAGSLSSILDPFGATVNYEHDFTGRLTSVTGSGGGASQYATGIQYRAWGARKHLSFGNNLRLDIDYTTRLQVKQYDIFRSQTYNPANPAASRVMGWRYEYEASGRLKYSQDFRDGRLDRAYIYDHAGQLILGLSGKEARGDYTAFDGPYHQNFGHDIWGNLTARSARAGTQHYSATYVNNRNQVWAYDEQGNITNDLTRQSTYDGASRIATISERGISQAYDGDGLVIKRVENNTTLFYLNSTALNGRVIAEIGTNGQRQRGYVYDDQGKLISKLEGAQVLWEHHEPSNTSGQSTDAGGAVSSRVETDPLGTKVNESSGSGTAPPYAINPVGFYGDANNPGGGCRGGNNPSPCNSVYRNPRGLGWGIGILQTYTWQTSTTRHIRNGASGSSSTVINGADANGNGGTPEQFLLMPRLSMNLQSYTSTSSQLVTQNILTSNFTTSGAGSGGGNATSQQPITAEYVRAKIVGDGDVAAAIVNSIVAIANSRKCAEAFAKYFLFTPLHIVKSHGFKLSGRATLNQSNAAQLLGWSQPQVDSARAAFDRDKKWYKPTYTADISYPRTPTIVFNASVINMAGFGGPRDIVTHAFLHPAGIKGEQTGGKHDLAHFTAYDEILKACR